MNKQETIHLLKAINQFYPGSMKLNPAMLDAWVRLLRSQETKEVMRRLDAHVMQRDYAPTIHDLFEKPRPEHNKQVLEQIKEWEAKSSGAPRKH